MGNKIRPDSYRLGINKGWKLRLFAKKNFRNELEESEVIRKIVRERISAAGIDRIEIEKSNANFRVLVRVSKPGLVIGRGGKGIEELSKGPRHDETVRNLECLRVTFDGHGKELSPSPH